VQSTWSERLSGPLPSANETRVLGMTSRHGLGHLADAVVLGARADVERLDAV
jgi:hypothetical protein